MLHSPRVHPGALTFSYSSRSFSIPVSPLCLTLSDRLVHVWDWGAGSGWICALGPLISLSGIHLLSDSDLWSSGAYLLFLICCSSSLVMLLQAALCSRIKPVALSSSIQIFVLWSVLSLGNISFYVALWRKDLTFDLVQPPRPEGSNAKTAQAYDACRLDGLDDIKRTSVILSLFSCSQCSCSVQFTRINVGTVRVCRPWTCWTHRLIFVVLSLCLQKTFVCLWELCSSRLSKLTLACLSWLAWLLMHHSSSPVLNVITYSGSGNLNPLPSTTLAALVSFSRCAPSPHSERRHK